jgi:hypothetical protein
MGRRAGAVGGLTMRTYFVALGLGIAAVLVGTVLGGAGPLLDAIVAPPLIVRAALVGASAVVALALLGRAVTALAGGGESSERDMPTMIRGVRLAFLAVAAAAASAGWFVGHPLLLVVALVIAGVDVVETTFLLIVARRHRIDEPEG